MDKRNAMSDGLKLRRQKLLEKLLENRGVPNQQILAKFAFDHGLREEKVQEYFIVIKKAGLLDE